MSVRGELESEAPIEFVLRAEPLQAPQAGSSTRLLERKLTAPWIGALELESGVSWRLSVEAKGYWTPPEILQPGNVAAVDLRLWPTGLLTGRLALPKDEPPPTEITVQLESVSADRRSRPEIPRATFRCPVTEGCWTCEVPGDSWIEAAPSTRRGGGSRAGLAR